MNCANARSQIHEFLDGELPGLQEAEIEEHLESCRRCRTYKEELRFVQQALSARVQFPLATEHLLWKRIQDRKGRTLSSWVRSGLANLSASFRDLDRRVVWTRLSAVPVSLGLFLLLLAMMPPSPQLLHFPALTELRPSTPMITVIEGRQDPRVLKEAYDRLENAILETHTEEEAALILDIRPGREWAELGDVRAHPKSQKVMDALLSSVLANRFEVDNKPRRIVTLFNSIEVQDSVPREGM